MHLLSQKREDFKESWATGEFVNSHDKADVYQNAAAIASCSVLEQVMNLSAEDLFGASDD